MRNKKLFQRLMAVVMCSALLATTPVMTYAAPDVKEVASEKVAPEPELGEVESEPGETKPEPEEGTTAPGVDTPESGTEDDEENTPPQADENGFVIDDGVLIRYEGDATDVVVPSTVTSIRMDVFLHGAYESITIPGTVKHINVMVESVKKLVLEEGIESIEVIHIFERNVSEVVIPSTVTSIGKCSITSNPVFYVGSSYYSKPLFGDLYVTKGSYAEKYFSENPVGLNVLSVYNNGCVTVQAMTGQAKGQEILLDYQGTSEKVVIPEDVDAICYSFSEYNNTAFVSEVVLHDNLVYISGNAFSDTVWMKNLRKENPVVIQNNWLLDARTASGEVVIPENVQIMGNAFYENKEVTKVVIPEGVTKIGYGWFQNCIALTEVVIPATVTEFEGDQEDCGIPFWGCESLKTISYGGTKEQWKAIDLFERYGEFHFSECPGVTVNCTDGSITYDTEGNVVAETDGETEEKPVIVEGWKKDSTGWWYQNADGTYPANCWKFIGNKWYAFNKNGYMREGWFYDGGKWYYLIPGSGQMAIGWAKDGNTWYYMNSTGAMTTGWIKDGGTWYYMKSSGAMATGWVNDGGTWYYMKSTGAMATGWVNDGGTWYYMKSTGAMATGWVKDGGTWYYMKSSGAMATGWIQDGGTWYYLSSSGAWVA